LGIKEVKTIRKQTITIKTFIPLLLISLALLLSLSTASADSNNTALPLDNLTVSDVQTTTNSSTTNHSSSESNPTVPDPVIYNGGVPVARGGQPAGYNWGSIQNAIENALSGDTIMLENGATFYEHNLTISKNLNFNVFDGGYATIDAQNLGRIFIINSGVTVHIYNLTLQNGYLSVGDGGAIYNSGTLTLTDCIFISNEARGIAQGGQIYGYAGGAIENYGALTVISSRFTDNLGGFGGAIDNIGTLVITDSIFNNNWAQLWIGSADTGTAGAIYNTGLMIILNSTFNNNMAGCGGAIANSGPLTIIDSTFSNNHAEGSGFIFGGAIYNWDGALTVTGSTFINNIAKISYGGMGSSGGGAIWTINAMNPTIINFNRFIGNSPNNSQIFSAQNTVDATLNWWGSNLSPVGKVEGPVLYDPWITLNITADPASIPNGGSSKITASLLYDNHGNFHEPTIGHVPDIPVTLNIPWGSFINPGMSQSFTANTVDGAMNTTFYANEGTAPINPVKVNATADEYTTSNTESTYINIYPVANLNITITGPSTAIAGTNITYIITITNNGFDPALNVELNDTFLKGLSAFNTGTLKYRYKTNDGDWSSWMLFTNPLNLDLGTIINSKNATIEVNGTVNASTTQGTVINNTVTTNTITTPGVKTASVENTVNTQADLNVTKTGPVSIIAGTQITYTITVENKGPSDAQNVVIVDNIPNILQNVGHDPFELGTILAGESRTIYINGTVPSSTSKGTTFQNIATVTSDTAGTITPSLLLSTTVDTLADVDLNKTVNNFRPDVGNTVTFTVTAHNYGPSDATNIQIQDIMPLNFTNMSITPSEGIYDIGTGIWTLNLTSGEEAILNLTGNVSAIMAGKNITNNATIISQTEEDPDTLDTANATIYVPKADLYIQITSDKNNPKVGEKFTITYKLGNNGPDPAENVTITIPIPEGFVISSITGDGNWTINGNTLTWTFNNVTVGDPYLHITGWTAGPGIYLFNALIFSKTFSINSMGVNSLSLNAQPKVSAATENTVGMQKTGAPIAGIVLAILMVLGGFISAGKKR
jgi:uncharacterized repeat protein (TIGR01451 family)